MEYKKLYIDFDNVIADSIPVIVSLYNEDYCGYENYEYIHWWDIETYEFKECKCATREALATYFNTPRFFVELKPMPHAVEVITRLSEIYHITVVTLGDYANLKYKRNWLKKYLPMVDMIGIPLGCSDKSQIDMSDGFFLDDVSKYLDNSNAKDKAVFGDIYEWNSEWNGRRLANWTDVEDYLLGRSPVRYRIGMNCTGH
jgi:putative 5'(3')-deoxyribonucleotidase